MKSMVALSRYVVDDGIAGGFHLVQQIGDETQMFPGNDDSNFLHGMQRETVHKAMLLSHVQESPSIRASECSGKGLLLQARSPLDRPIRCHRDAGGDGGRG